MAYGAPIELFRWHPNTIQEGTNITNRVLDSATDYLAFVFSVHSSGPVLTKAAIRPGALTGTSPTYVLALEGVASTGYPDGIIKGGGSPVSVEITPAADAAGIPQIYTFANSYDSSPGEILALTIRPKSGTSIDASNNWSFTQVCVYADDIMPYACYNLTGTPTKSRATAFGVSDGTTWWGSTFGAAQTSAYYGGCKFTMPFTASCVGFWGCVNLDASTTWRLYSMADTVLAQANGIPTAGVGYNRPGYWYWTSGPVELVRGTTYRIYNSNYGTSFGYRLDFGAGNQALFTQQEGNNLCTAGGAGAWVDLDGRYLPVLGPLVEQASFSDPPASGGGGPVVGSRIVRGLGAL